MIVATLTCLLKMSNVMTKASDLPLVFTNKEKDPARAFSLLKKVIVASVKALV